MATKSIVLTINEVAEELSLSPVYIRRAILNGTLASKLVPINEDSKTLRHQIKRVDMVAWRKNTRARHRRTDGRLKFTMYATVDEHQAVTEFLSKSQVNAIVQRANKQKPKPKKAKAAVNS